MSTLQEKFNALPIEERAWLLGTKSENPLGCAFAKKRVVHPGAGGKRMVMDKEEQTRIWADLMAQTPNPADERAVYIHIPFCDKKCSYCGFFQNFTREEAAHHYVDVLLDELDAAADTPYVQGAPFQAVFFGLSGTGKTTLSTDPKRLLIGDDEHGWDDSGVFNFEGGCYAKVINLDKESEPDIYNAIRRDALLENVTVDADGKIDFTDKSVTENTRVSYPIDHIEKIVKPVSHGPAAENVIFLSADAFGVLPPVSILTPEQTKYYFLSGFTAKLAGTERGITEPTPTFSACFGQAFLELHPTKYAEELVKRMEQSGAKAYLVNTGWNGSGKRISIKDTRGIIDAILNGDVLKAPTKKIPFFDFEVPTELPGVNPAILDPRDTYADSEEWNKKAKDLAERFIKNFVKYEGNAAGKALVAAGPKTEA